MHSCFLTFIFKTAGDLNGKIPNHGVGRDVGVVLSLGDLTDIPV